MDIDLSLLALLGAIRTETQLTNGKLNTDAATPEPSPETGDSLKSIFALFALFAPWCPHFEVSKHCLSSTYVRNWVLRCFQWNRCVVSGHDTRKAISRVVGFGIELGGG